MRKKHSSYQPVEFNQDSPLSSEESQLLMQESNSGIKFTDEQIRHILRRVLVTVNYLRQVRIDFDNEIRKRSAIGARNVAASVDPMTAAKFLTPEQRLQLSDQMTRDKIAIMNNKISEAEKSVQILGEILNIIDINKLPDELKKRINEIRK